MGVNVLPVFSLQGVRQCHTAGAEQSATTLKSIIEEGIAARFGLEIPVGVYSVPSTADALA